MSPRQVQEIMKEAQQRQPPETAVDAVEGRGSSLVT